MYISQYFQILEMASNKKHVLFFYAFKFLMYVLFFPLQGHSVPIGVDRVRDRSGKNGILEVLCQRQ